MLLGAPRAGAGLRMVLCGLESPPPHVWNESKMGGKRPGFCAWFYLTS